MIHGVFLPEFAIWRGCAEARPLHSDGRPMSLLLSSWIRRRPRVWWSVPLLVWGASVRVRVRAGAARHRHRRSGISVRPDAIGVQPIAYVQDIKPIFDRDCSSCHSGRETAGGLFGRAPTPTTMAGQRPGDASSSVVVDCSPGGSMYRYFTGDAVTKATMVFRWMVVLQRAAEPLETP